MRWIAVIGMAVLLAGAGAARAQSEADVNARIDAVLSDSGRYEIAIKAFQQAVTEGNKQDVAAFMRYPIKVAINGHKTTIKSSKSFVRRYDEIMTPDITDAIKTQKYEDLFVNYRGVMFGNGQAWLDRVCLDRHCRQSVVQVITLQHAAP